MAVRAMEALVAFQRGGGVDDEGVGFRDPSETGDGIGEKVEVEECSDEGGGVAGHKADLSAFR